MPSSLCAHCLTHTTFTFPDQRTPIASSDHRTEGMVDVRNRHCEELDCRRRA